MNITHLNALRTLSHFSPLFHLFAVLPQATIRLTKDASAPKAAAVVAALSALPASEISGGADGAAVFAVVKADDEAKVWAVLEEKRAALKAAMAARGAQGQGGNKRRMGGSHGTKRTRR